MRTANKEKTYICTYSSSYFVEKKSKARLCARVVRDAFHIPRANKIEFVVTNSKPKNLTDWHVLKKDGNGWRITKVKSISHCGLLWDADEVLSANFPKNSTLYVCAY